WLQKADGQDDLQPTDDLILSPPISRLAPISRQTFRLLRTGAPPAGEQQTYRLFVREVPDAKPRGEGNAVQITLAFSLPVFITPPGAKRKLDCKAGRKAPDMVSVSCQNSGMAYAQVRDIHLLGATGAKLA